MPNFAFSMIGCNSKGEDQSQRWKPALFKNRVRGDCINCGMHVVGDETSGTPLDRGPEREGMPSTRAIIKKERKHSSHRGHAPNTIKNGLHISICTSEYRRGIHTKCATGKSEMTKEREKNKTRREGGGNTSTHKNVVVSEREVRTFLSF